MLSLKKLLIPLIMLAFLLGSPIVQADRPVVVWDNIERGPDDTASSTPDGTIHFYNLVEGFSEVKRDAPTKNGLAAASGYILYAPLLPPEEQEINDIVAYIKNGGRMLLTIYHSGSCRKLLERLSVKTSAQLIRDDTNKIPGDSHSIFAFPASESELTKEMDKIVLSGAYCLSGPEKSTTPLIKSGPNSFIDANQNGIHDDPQPRGSCPVAIKVALEKGEVIIIGDDAVFFNQAISPGINRLFARRIAMWLARIEQ